MNNLVLHERTRKNIASFIGNPGHALLIVGANGSGKSTLARSIIAQLLELPPDRLVNYPYLSVISSNEKASIGIDDVRALQHFTSLKTPAAPGMVRFAVIEDAQLMTAEAQNALLKLIEEPPNETLIILTVSNKKLLLPTILSRTQSITVFLPADEDIKNFFKDSGYPDAAISQAWMVSDGLPGMMSALLAQDSQHALAPATDSARQLLQKSPFDRLIEIDSLAKQPQMAQDVIFVLQQMARVALKRNQTVSAARKWQQVLAAALKAGTALTKDANAKLTLTDLMLSL